MRTIENVLPVAARLLLGFGFALFGLNGFLHFMPAPPLPDEAGALLGAFAASGYMFPLIKGTELVAGLLLLRGRFVPLALLLLAPVVVNILAFHAFLAPAGTALPLVLAGLGLYVAWTERDAFRAVLRARSTAHADRASTSAPRVARAAA